MDDPLRLAVELEKALESVEIAPESAAAVALVRLYARLLDEPAIGGKYRIPVQHLRKCFEHFSECESIRVTPMEARGLEQAEATIVTALAEHSTTSDLGPKLQSALTALNLVLPVKKAPAPAPELESSEPAKPPNARDELKERRVARERGA